MSRKRALALLGAGALVAALLVPTAALAEGRPCADITRGLGGYDPDDAVPLLAKDTGPDGTLTQFAIYLAAPPCQDLTYTMYVMDEVGDLTLSSKGEPVFKEGVAPLATLTDTTSGSDEGGSFLEYADPDVRITDDDGGEEDNTICVFHTVTNAAGHVFDYGTPVDPNTGETSAPCAYVPKDPGARSYG